MYTFCKSIYTCTAYVSNRRHFSEADWTQACGHLIFGNIVDRILEFVVVYCVTDQVFLCLVNSVSFNDQCLFNSVLGKKTPDMKMLFRERERERARMPLNSCWSFLKVSIIPSCWKCFCFVFKWSEHDGLSLSAII